MLRGTRRKRRRPSTRESDGIRENPTRRIGLRFEVERMGFVERRTDALTDVRTAVARRSTKSSSPPTRLAPLRTANGSPATITVRWRRRQSFMRCTSGSSINRRHAGMIARISWRSRPSDAPCACRSREGAVPIKRGGAQQPITFDEQLIVSDDQPGCC